MPVVYRITGRYDDLIQLLARAETARYPYPIPQKGFFSRLLIEPVFHLLGAAIAAVVSVLPASLVEAFHDKLFLALLGKGAPLPFDHGSPHFEEAKSLLSKGGPGAVLLCVASHPPAHGELLYLTVEAMRHALWALRRASASSARPRIVVAVDYFGLDGLQGYEEGAYAGYMTRRHLGFDRLAHLRPAASRWLVPAAAWPKLSWRLLRTLRAGEPAALMLGGGVPVTSRVFYAAREFAGQLWRRRPSRCSPAAARAALEADADFQGFLAAQAVGAPLLRGARKSVEAWLLWRLTRPMELGEADAGRLAPGARKVAEAAARAFGYDEKSAAATSAEFSDEFRRATPYRARLFGVLLRRLVGRGRPLVILPLDWGSPQKLAMKLRAPALIESSGHGWRVTDADGHRHSENELVFAKSFVERSFPE